MVIDTNAGGVGRNRLNAPPQETSTAKPSSNGGSPSVPSASPSDSVSLSGAAKAMSRLESKIQASPDVDISKVEQAKLAISQGQYHADPAAIADKMLKDF